MREFDDAQVMAYADGVLEAPAADLVRAAAAVDPALQARIDLFRASTQILRGAFDPVLDAPVPARLLRAAGVEPMVGRSQPRARTFPSRLGIGLALAASIALGVAVLLRAPMPTSAPTPVALALEADTLEHQASGEPKSVTSENGSIEVLVLATYRAPDGRYCRSYEVVDGASASPQRKLACRAADGGWFAQDMIASASPDAGSYAPAGGGGVPASFLAVDFDQEAHALRSGWKQ